MADSAIHRGRRNGDEDDSFLDWSGRATLFEEPEDEADEDEVDDDAESDDDAS